MPRLTPEREAFLRSNYDHLTELFDELDALRHDAKSFNRNFEFMKQELEECEQKNKKLMKVGAAAREGLSAYEVGVHGYDSHWDRLEDALKELDGEK